MSLPQSIQRDVFLTKIWLSGVFDGSRKYLFTFSKSFLFSSTVYSRRCFLWPRNGKSTTVNNYQWSRHRLQTERTRLKQSFEWPIPHHGGKYLSQKNINIQALRLSDIKTSGKWTFIHPWFPQEDSMLNPWWTQPTRSCSRQGWALQLQTQCAWAWARSHAKVEGFSGGDNDSTGAASDRVYVQCDAM